MAHHPVNFPQQVRLVLTGFMLMISVLVHGQDELDYTIPAGEKPESVQNYNRVMIVPFNMTYYLSDADHELARDNKKTRTEVQQAFRYGMDMSVGVTAAVYYPSKRILTDTIPSANEDLKQLFGAVQYQYRKPAGLQLNDDRHHTEKEKSLADKFRNALGGNPELSENAGDPYFESGAVRGPVEGKKYLHAELQQPEVLEKMFLKFGTDLFIFLNQFELRTNYAHCLDRATGNYVREVSIHYSIYDYTGKFIDGNVLTVQFDSETRKLQEIMNENFPQLTALVAEKLPPSKLIRDEVEE